MNKQTSNKPYKDLAKKRRGYLLEKASADAATGVGAIATFGCIGLCLLLVLIMLFGVAFVPWFAKAAVFAVGLIVLFILGSLAWFCRMFWRSSAEAGRAIPYVPPVAEQIAALPSDEILLRGSDLPAATPEQLLRAAERAGMETAPEELLRPSD